MGKNPARNAGKHWDTPVMQLEEKFGNSVHSMPVGDKSFIRWVDCVTIKHKDQSLTKYWGLTEI